MLCRHFRQIQEIASRWHAKGRISQGFLPRWGFSSAVKWTGAAAEGMGQRRSALPVAEGAVAAVPCEHSPASSSLQKSFWGVMALELWWPWEQLKHHAESSEPRPWHGAGAGPGLWASPSPLGPAMDWGRWQPARGGNTHSLLFGGFLQMSGFKKLLLLPH